MTLTLNRTLPWEIKKVIIEGQWKKIFIHINFEVNQVKLTVENIISLSSATLQTTICDVEHVMIIIRFPESIFNL